MGNVALAFTAAELFQQGADGAPKRLERVALGLTQHVLLCSIGFKSSLYGGNYLSATPAPSMSCLITGHLMRAQVIHHHSVANCRNHDR